MSIPRRHHKVPESYLTGFTDDGTENGSLFVFNRKKLEFRIHPSKPRNVAVERDYYRLEVAENSETDPFALEKAFATIEGDGMKILRLLANGKRPPTASEHGPLVAYLGLQYARTDRIRVQMEEFETRGAMKMLELAAKHYSREKFDRIMRDTYGAVVPEYATLENFREGVMKKRFTISKTQGGHLYSLGHAFKTITDLLAERTWSAIEAPSGTHFITSDHPLTLTWQDPARVGRPAGFGLENTNVYFPIQKDVALVGVLEKTKPRMNPVTKQRVAEINTATLGYSVREVYSPVRDFAWSHEGKVSQPYEFVQYVGRNRRMKDDRMSSMLYAMGIIGLHNGPNWD